MDNLGGKYWRQNPDGSISEFTPPDLQFEVIKSNLFNVLGIENFTVLEGYRVCFQTEKIAQKTVPEFCDLFWELRNVSAHAEGCEVVFHIPNEILENTYFPALSSMDD